MGKVQKWLTLANHCPAPWPLRYPEKPPDLGWNDVGVWQKVQAPLIRQWTCLDQIRLSEILTRHCSVVGETQVEASLESPPTRTTCSSQGQANLSLSSPGDGRDVCLPCQARDDCIQDAKRKLVSPIYPFRFLQLQKLNHCW